MAASQLRLNMMWMGTRPWKYNVSKIPVCYCSLTRGLVGSDTVRVLGILLTPGLSLDKYVTAVSAKCFFSFDVLYRRQLSHYSRTRVRR